MDIVERAKILIENETVYDTPTIKSLIFEIERLQNLFDVERRDNIKIRGLLATANEDIERVRLYAYRMASLAIDNAKDTDRALRYRKALEDIAKEQSAKSATIGADMFQFIARAALKESE